jgi:hypothetical protein
MAASAARSRRRTSTLCGARVDGSEESEGRRRGILSEVGTDRIGLFISSDFLKKKGRMLHAYFIRFVEISENEYGNDQRMYSSCD